MHLKAPIKSSYGATCLYISSTHCPAVFALRDAVEIPPGYETGAWLARCISGYCGMGGPGCMHNHRDDVRSFLSYITRPLNVGKLFHVYKNTTHLNVFQFYCHEI